MPIRVNLWLEVKLNMTQTHFITCANLCEHLSQGSHIWSLFVPIHVKGGQKSGLMSSWTQFKHSFKSVTCTLEKSYLVIIWQEMYWKVDQKRTDVIFGSVRTLLKITHYMKGWQKVKLDQVGSNMTQILKYSRTLFVIIICPNSH